MKRQEKFIKKAGILLLICIVVFFAMSLASCARANPYVKNQPDNGFVMNSLNVDIDASSGDGSMLISETYVFTYLNELNGRANHGFYRDIPLASGEKIRDIRVSTFRSASGSYSIDRYVVSHVNSELLRVTVKDDDAIIPLNEPLKCSISYKMITPPIKGQKDVLAINAIGHGWTCGINKADIRVKLPSKSEKTEFYYGEWGETNIDNTIKSQTDDNITYNLSLENIPAFNGVTLYYGLAAGALSYGVDVNIFITLAVTLALIILALVLKGIFRNPPLTPITNFYPPSNAGGKQMNPLEMGYLIDARASGSDVTSLIFYWASKGALEIDSNGKKGKKRGENGDSDNAKDDEIYLVKKRELPNSCAEYERIFFDKIFSSGDRVSVSSLTNTAYTAVTEAKQRIVNEYSGKIHDKKSKVASYFLSGAAIVFSFVFVLLAYFRISKTYFNPFGIVAIIPVLVATFFGNYIVDNWLKIEKKRKLFVVLYFIAMALASLFVMLFIKSDAMGVIEKLIFTLGIFASASVAPFVTRRKSGYTAQLNEIVGFREFLVVAEKDRLEALIEENPQYYYDILPYANVLGVSDVWENKFVGLTIRPPDYWRGDYMFDFLMFNMMFHTSFTRINSAVTSAPISSSSSGGSFGGFGGGGGFSGGGFGGGGGGRC